jgi:multisubunit Na+/H+ antiporter MnhB subunit
MDVLRHARRWAAAVLCSAAGAVLVLAILSLPEGKVGLAGEVAARLERSGVESPVTAVLLNFRAYDTLLELGVLWLALLGVWSAGAPTPPPPSPPAGPVVSALVRQLVPVMVLVAAYLLWVGASAPGGAFQAGAILAGSGVLLLLSGMPFPRAARALPPDPLVVLGFALFLGVGVALALAGGRFLELPPERAGGLILLVEVAATISIATVLVALFAGRPSTEPPAAGSGSPRRSP